MELRKVSQLLYQLKIVNQEMTSKFEKETGFSLTRYELMMFLKENGQSSQTELQSELKIDSAAVTRHLKILESKGYVVRERNQENHREIFVEITDMAKTELVKCEDKHDPANDPLNISLTDEETEQLLALLKKIN